MGAKTGIQRAIEYKKQMEMAEEMEEARLAAEALRRAMATNKNKGSRKR